ncbi:MAG: AAA family ATPase, partial [Succinivibrionaceae bacterium]
MSSILNPSNEDFSKFVNTQSNFYIDKTDYISETIKQINSEGRYICFTRPRRFGKTITAKMLSAYYSKGCDSKELFANLKIAQDPSFLTHLNKYNVIYIDMNSIKAKYEDFISVYDNHPIIKDIVDFIQFSIMWELKQVQEFADSFVGNPFINDKSVVSALSVIYEKLRAKFIFIMDEWDLIYREYKNDT